MLSHIHWTYFLPLHPLLATLFSVFLLTQAHQRRSETTLTWILAFFLIPYLSILIFILAGYRYTLRKKAAQPNPTPQRHCSLQDSHNELPHDFHHICTLTQNLTDFPPTRGNSVGVLDKAYLTYKALTEAITSARHHVHLEYYIFRPDEAGKQFRDLLIEKAQQGVECRLLVDAVGSFSLSSSFLRPLEKAGVEVAFFWPLRLRSPWGFHLRNHRKLAIIDGTTGFIGSQNIGNEYFQWRKRKVLWRDVAVQVHGPAVAHLQSIFVEDWSFTTKTILSGERYFPENEPSGESVMQVIPTGPKEADSALEMILTSLFHHARERISILTPYFIPTSAFVLTLKSLAQQGIAVEILLPQKSDHWLVSTIAKSWYGELLEAGVKIFESTKAFVHAKVAIIDDTVSFIGSANMDRRSFYINFESSLLVFDRNLQKSLVGTLADIKSESKELHLAELAEPTSFSRLRDNIVQIASPLL